LCPLGPEQQAINIIRRRWCKLRIDVLQIYPEASIDDCGNGAFKRYRFAAGGVIRPDIHVTPDL